MIYWFKITVYKFFVKYINFFINSETTKITIAMMMIIIIVIMTVLVTIIMITTIVLFSIIIITDFNFTIIKQFVVKNLFMVMLIQK